jgi:alpha-glucoside transport system ATP-binding protein
MANLQLKNISKSYGPVEVLKEINLDIKKGEFIVFVGPSGCGKSTLLRMIAGLEKITGGDLTIDEMLMNDVPPAKRGIAMVFQSYALYPHMSVRDNMAFAMRIAKKSKKEIDETVTKAAKILQLDEYLDRLPKALSGGQRQRVAIGRAIVRDPKIFLFDEPLSNLDAALRVATRIEIAQLKAQMPNSTMIYVTHDQVEAMTLADRIVVLAGGGISQVGSPLELYDYPKNIFVAQFIGSPAMNLFDGKINAIGRKTNVKLENGQKVILPIKSNSSDKGKKVKLGVRPEDFTLARGDDFLYEGKIRFVEALGEVTLLHLDPLVGNDCIVAKLSGNYVFEDGQIIRLKTKANKIHLFDDAGLSFYWR